MEKLTISI